MRQVAHNIGMQDHEVLCPRCGKRLLLYFNRGELDRKECCGLVFETVITCVDLIIRDENEKSSLEPPADSVCLCGHRYDRHSDDAESGYEPCGECMCLAFYEDKRPTPADRIDPTAPPGPARSS